MQWETKQSMAGFAWSNVSAINILCYLVNIICTDCHRSSCCLLAWWDCPVMEADSGDNTGTIAICALSVPLNTYLWRYLIAIIEETYPYINVHFVFHKKNRVIWNNPLVGNENIPEFFNVRESMIPFSWTSTSI